MNLESLETRTARPLPGHQVRREDESDESSNDHGTRIRSGTNMRMNLQDLLWPIKDTGFARGKKLPLGKKHHRSVSESMKPRGSSSVMMLDPFSSFRCGPSTLMEREHHRSSNNTCWTSSSSNASNTLAAPQSESALNIMGSTPTQSIPIDKDSMKRTDSEVKLVEDEAAADYRDYTMYHRIVSGMIQDQHSHSWCGEGSLESSTTKMETVRHIMETRQRPVESPPSSYTRDSRLRYGVFANQPSSSSCHPFHQSAPSLMGGEAPLDSMMDWHRQPEFSSLSLFNDEDHDRSDHGGVFVMDDV